MGEKRRSTNIELHLHSAGWTVAIVFLNLPCHCWPSLWCLSETLQRWKMLKWRLMMERMSLRYRTQCISKFIQTLALVNVLNRKHAVIAVHSLLFCSNIRKKITPFVMSFGFRWVGNLGDMPWVHIATKCHFLGWQIIADAVLFPLVYSESYWSSWTLCWWLWTSPCQPGTERLEMPWRLCLYSFPSSFSLMFSWGCMWRGEWQRKVTQLCERIAREVVHSGLTLVIWPPTPLQQPHLTSQICICRIPPTFQ